MSPAMRTLVTNDDGIDSPGLHRLAAAARDEGLDVVIAAPADQSSGSSAAITAGVEDHNRVSLERRTVDGLADVRSYAVGAAPALIALIAAHGAFGPPPDIVLSGINHGANVGQAILHSGPTPPDAPSGTTDARTANPPDAPSGRTDADYLAAGYATITAVRSVGQADHPSLAELVDTEVPLTVR